jgi:hypothetical protein
VGPTVADLAFAMRVERDRSKRADETKSIKQIAEEFGFERSYGNRLLKLADSLTPEVLRKWREDSKSRESEPVGFNQIKQILTHPAKDQMREYEKLIRSGEVGRGAGGGRRARRQPAAWFGAQKI